MGPVHRPEAVHLKRPARRSRDLLVLAALLMATACASGPAQPRDQRPDPLTGLTVPGALPDTSGWGVHVLTLTAGPNGAVWAGTYGMGIYVWPRGAREWRRLAEGDSGISWGFVNSIAFHDSLHVWYGTVGNGFGYSADGGATWRNWSYDALGPQWQYVAPRGIVVQRDTVYIATTDGLRISGDRGTTWRCVQGVGAVPGGSPPREDGCTERINALPNKYLLALDVAQNGVIWAGHLGGLSISRDGGRTWTGVQTEGIAGANVRDVVIARDSFGVTNWVATEQRIFVDSSSNLQLKAADIRVPGFAGLPGAPRALIPAPFSLPPAIATSYGLVARMNEGGYRMYFVGAADRFRPAGDTWTALWFGPPYRALGGAATGLHRVLAGNLPFSGPITPTPGSAPVAARHLWFLRPIAAAEGNTHIDGTYRYGSTMGGRFQQHQGVEFNNPAGTAVRAIGDGVVVYAGAGEQGSNTVAVRHDRQLDGQHVFSTYYHNSSLDVRAGQRVSAGDVIARVGNTGRATNEHLHLEVHVAPSPDSALIVDPAVRYPQYTVNPQLWLEPLAGTGIVAGHVFDAAGQPIPGATIHGLVLPYPEETPFSFAETYGDRARGSPAYGEHFAVGDVPAGTYTLGVIIDGSRVWRRVRVQPGMLTWVEFRP
jgi:murein DD-endopeptidase MepM/ murein hydrolase activator NlpD